MSFKGSCLCKTVQYEVREFSTPIRHCHCGTCRKAHSAAFNTGAGVLREHFRWIGGEDKLNAFESSPGKLRKFCSMCGAHIVADYPDRPYLVLRIASLDDDPGTLPMEHIWVSQMPSWLHDREGAAYHPEWYPGYP